MLPRWHILWGAVFSIAVWLFLPGVSLFYISLIFLASFLIDFDHYLAGAMSIRDYNLKNVLKYHRELLKKEKEENKNGIRVRGHFHLFHTLEFHILVFALGYLWQGFWFILAGMIFHSLLDIASLISRDRLYRREYFLVAWLLRKA